MSRYVQGVVVAAVCLCAVFASCRRNQPSLVDRNQPPDTELWSAPPDSSEYEYTVHLYWRGVDSDGTARRFIWAIQDTIALGDARWNPSQRLSDFRQGRITSRTDSIFSFTAFKDVAGVGVRKNRQAFFVASIDDNGVIDPFPAGVEFVATIDRLPQIRFTTDIRGTARPYTPLPTPRDTVGMFKPFSISYHGFTTNGQVRGYEFFALNSAIVLPGAGLWTEDLSDTLRDFPNTGASALPRGVFRFAARCLDDANAQSAVDAGSFQRGVCQVVVNFDPDTRITEVKNTYFKNRNPIVENVNFTDGVPDTVPYKSWLYLRYNGRDDSRDVATCSPTDADRCINFQLKYIRNSARTGGFEDSGWLPRNGSHDSDCNSATDSNSVNIGSVEYDWKVAAMDENQSRDGTPATIHVVGNFDPTIDTFSLRDYRNNLVNVATVDTMRWYLYKGVGWPYNSRDDTVVVATGQYYKRFAFTLNTTGHDHPKDPDGSAIKTWRYYVFTNYNPGTGTGEFQPMGRDGDSWFPGSADNVMSDRADVEVRYSDGDGDDLFASPPPYFNTLVTLVVYGRDTKLLEPDFRQTVFWDEALPDSPCGSGVSKPNIINVFSGETLGRWTPKKVVTFYLKVVR